MRFFKQKIKPVCNLILCLQLALACQLSWAAWKELKPIYGGGIYAIAPDAGGVLFAITSGGLVKSTDGGGTWTSALGNLPTTAVSRVIPDPIEVGVIYISTDQGLFRTFDSGISWTRLPLNLPTGVSIQEFVVAPGNTNYIFVATLGDYVYRSLDRGVTWVKSYANLFGGAGGPAFIQAIAVDPINPNRVYTSTWRGNLFRSDDAGASWYQISAGGTWANGQIYISRSNPNILVTTHDEYWFGRGTVLKSMDYGDSWTNIGRPSTGPSQGGASDAGQIAINPDDPNIIYVTTGQGLHKTITGGGNWIRIYTPSGQTNMLSVAIASGAPGIIYGGSYFSGFVKSSDAGQTWEQCNTGIASASINGLAVCRDYPNFIYVSANGHGPMRSGDGGETWNNIGTSQNLKDQWMGKLIVHPQDQNIVILSTSDTNASHLLRSTDGGSSFITTSTSYSPSFISINPFNPNIIHASVSDWQGGFLYSTNNGTSWYVPQSWYIYVQNYDFHPFFPNIVFAGGSQYTGAPLGTKHIMWSNNQGASGWNSITFGQGRLGPLITLDKSDPSILYAAGSVQSDGSEGILKFRITYNGANVASISRISGTFNNGLTSTEVRWLHYNAATQSLYASTPNGVFCSKDQAISWNSITIGLPYPSVGLITTTPDGSKLIAATSGGIWEYSDSTPIPPQKPEIMSSASELLQIIEIGSTLALDITAQSICSEDTIQLQLDESQLESGMNFSVNNGNPATGNFTFTPGGAQKGHTFPLKFKATSTLDTEKFSELEHYISVIKNGSTDTAALLSINSAGKLSTPDNQFTMDIAPGSIQSANGIAMLNIIESKNINACDVYVFMNGKNGKAKAISMYDIGINNLEHYVFLKPVALTFAIPAGIDPAITKIMVYDENVGAFIPATETACLAEFNLLPFTGDEANGGTISICTTTVSKWAAIDITTFVSVSDTTAPVLHLPDNITTDATDATGAVVNFTVTATDDTDPNPVVTSDPASGSTFPIGTTTVNCTALDASGNVANGSFTITIIKPNIPPVVNAGENISIKTSEISTTVIQGMTSDEDVDDILQYRWKEGESILLDWTGAGGSGECPLNLAATSLGIGTHILFLEVTDGIVTVTDGMILTIENSAPHAAPSGSGVYEINSNVILGGSVSDYDGDLLNYKWREGETVLFESNVQPSAGGGPITLPNHSISTLSNGIHTITLQVSDVVNTPVSSSVTVQIVDTTVPTLAPVADQTILWPPNHQMVDITIQANAADNGGPVTLAAAISSNEPVNGLGDGDQAPDWTEPVINQQTGLITFQLRAERSGTGSGRIYTITISATDNSNNTSTANLEIIVPHDKKK